MDEEAILQASIDRWGVEAQCMVAIEEAGELIQALVHNWRGRESNVVEEIADMDLILTQLKRIFGKDEVERIRLAKLTRLNQRILDHDRRAI